MKQVIRAEDFDVVEDRIILGGRLVEGNSVVFAHIEKRVSLELLGFGVGNAACIAIAANAGSGQAVLGMGLIIALLGLGARREIQRPYVLVMELYQLGIFEIRGFTPDEAPIALDVVESLRSQSRHGGAGRLADFVSNRFG